MKNLVEYVQSVQNAFKLTMENDVQETKFWVDLDLSRERLPRLVRN